MNDPCQRCGGLLALESLPGDIEDPITLVKCINCGDRVDPLINFHRLLNAHHLNRLERAS